MTLLGAAISLGATIVSALFAALVLRQWLARRKPYQFVWSLGLGLYAVAAFTQFLAETYGWSVPVYKVYYLVAAALVGVLGAGSILLIHRRAGNFFGIYTVIAFVAFVIAVAQATVNVDAFLAPIPVAGTALPDGNVRAFSFLFTIPGSVALIGIAVYSYWRTRLAFNLWIGVGALIIAIGGSLARYNIPLVPYTAVVVGVVGLLEGFLLRQDPGRVAMASTAPSPACVAGWTICGLRTTAVPSRLDAH